MAHDWWRPLTTLCFMTVLLGPGVGERFFQYRDHRDQQLYEKHMGSLTVHNKQDAEQQLEKYGYLHCRIQQRHKRSLFPEVMSEGHSGGKPSERLRPSVAELPPCSRREVRKAIRQYQKTYKLPETGILDRQTKRFMSTSRCGNSDKDDSVSVIEDTERTSTSDRLNKFIHKQSDKTNSKTGPNSWGDKFKTRPWKRSTSHTKLMKVIAGKDKTSSLVRRKRYLHEYIDRLKTTDPMVFNAEKQKTDDIIKIKKRSSEHGTVIEHIDNTTRNDGQKFEKQIVRWRLLETGFSSRIPVEDQRSTIDLAFRMWSEVIPLKFVEETSGDIASVDIEVAFGKGAHQNCKRDFDGRGGEIAHSFSTGNMHFDDDEHFKSMRSFTPDGIYLLRVAVHEIGHVLGLMHTNKKYSIMYAIYEKESSSPDFELGWEDRKAVQQVYGVCKGRFNTVFDWVRKSDNGQFIFNTYFFRGNHYWMYENHANRTRYGDPLYISREWGGLPNEPDGYTHVWYYTVNAVVDDAYFYKDDNVYKYNNAKDAMYEGWPRKIQDVYAPKPGQHESIPNNLDTVFFDMRDKNIYFFKDDMVYVYDPKEPEETRGCCVRKAKLQDEFPAAPDNKPLPPNLDSVYYSYKDSTMYFIKDEDVWENVLYHPRQIHVKNSVKHVGKWFEKWFDICDVTTHSTHVFGFQNSGT